MQESSGTRAAEVTTDTVGALGDLAARLGFASAQVLLARAAALHAAYRAALRVPEAFAGGRHLSRSESHDLVERSIRAELAVALRLSERALSHALEHALLLVEDLPRTREALAAGLILWEASEVVCAAASTLPTESRAALDARAAAAALTTTPTQLRRAVGRIRDDVHGEPLAKRHARARADRTVWVSPEYDGMATLCAVLPAPSATARARSPPAGVTSARSPSCERTRWPIC
ncbi:DUF222 domain-containing protein [Rathayibacter sp. VKM Ac-2803]|nr:DUF222 domain-containing protein [Rathayibacter sp. VKM Ac-2803]